MDILVCIKRVPITGAHIPISEDGQEVVTRNLGFTIGPHEECAVEEAVRIVERLGGSVTVLTLGSDESEKQLRDSMAVGADRAILLKTNGREWDPVATANAIVDAVRTEEAAGQKFDLLLFGNEAADTGGYQVGIRVATALGLPCVAGIKGIEIKDDGTVTARREAGGGWEIYEVPLPAVLTVKEGLNLPRYPSVPGRLKAKKKPLQETAPEWKGGGLEMIRLKTPPSQGSAVQILGNGASAAPKVVAVLKELGLV
jgi:electron transfer flavoprotein beta subunit